MAAGLAGRHRVGALHGVQLFDRQLNLRDILGDLVGSPASSGDRNDWINVVYRSSFFANRSTAFW